MNRKFAPVHPGEILLDEFLNPMGITHYQLAKDINVPPRRINEIVHGKRAISADTALRLSRYFGMIELLSVDHDITGRSPKTGGRAPKGPRPCFPVFL
ncbi:MAG TPA: HigA family addiction module antitoxin [Anaerolineales bacterium]|nr:HigA family addiction module antitoxin [Anaerolineales bacterium]